MIDYQRFFFLSILQIEAEYGTSGYFRLISTPRPTECEIGGLDFHLKQVHLIRLYFTDYLRFV